MIFLMTKDSFLLQGFWQLKDNHEMIKINSLSEIKKVGNKPFKVIIDTYHNHILDEEAIKFLEKLDAERIIVLAPYHISKLKAKAPIYFVSRKESIKNLLEITYGKHLQVQGSTPVQLNLENGKRYSQTGTLKFSDPTVDETTGSVTLWAIFPNPNGDLLPGMYVTALVDEGSRQNVLLVPQEGVTHNAQGKATALILDKDDVVQLREIEASKAIGDQWVVTSGLQAGDRVIVSGLQRIRPGIKARAISSSQENASTESKQ